MRTPARTIKLAESAHAAMVSAAQAALPTETGGVLLGVLADGDPWVTRAVELLSTDSGPSHFRIAAGRTRAAVREARKSEPRLGYLGEWHSHPADIGPSTTDRSTMRRLAARATKVAPILVVVRATTAGWSLDAHQASVGRVTSRALIYTGDLQPATTTNRKRP